MAVGAVGANSQAAGKKTLNVGSSYYVAAADPDTQPISNDQLGTGAIKKKTAKKTTSSNTKKSKKTSNSLTVAFEEERSKQKIFFMILVPSA